MLSLAFSLLVAAAVSFAFKSTRAIGILCIALFTFVFPWVALGLLASALFCLFIFRSR
ncbi:hypothetical protein J7U46_20865 [Pelomonas sp. V22]|uniref:hypothetical protein n=1 Tax=Pelomonas sp. V22 TaxID=2822139 RepID=UPI0024A80140|nr:hypothetical protein [Pelomonas sp. V22]MDI4635528.1 hypothetical protein [Pelomonas sp. V22]